MRSMAVVIHRVRIIIDEIETAGDFATVADGYASSKIRMGIVNAGVDDRNRDIERFVARVVYGTGANPLNSPGVVQLCVDFVEESVRFDGRNARISPQCIDGRLRQSRGNDRNQMVGVFDSSTSAPH